MKRPYLVGVVVKMLAAEEEAELGVVPLLGLGHVLEGGTVARHELRQLVDDVPDLGVGRRRGRRRGARVHGFPGNVNTFENIPRLSYEFKFILFWG